MENNTPKSGDSGSSLTLSADGSGRPKEPAPSQTDGSACGLVATPSGRASGIQMPARALIPDRTPELDRRVALHEAGHILCGKWFAFPIAFATIDPCDGYAGMVRASAEASFLSPTHIAELCEKVRPLMPAIGEPRSDIAEFHAHAHCRTIELLAGTESERLFYAASPPLRAEHDLQEAKSFAGIICTSPSSVDAFIEFARVEARAMLADHRHVVLALAHALVERRTLDGSAIDKIIALAVAEQGLADEKLRQRQWHAVEASAAMLGINQSAMRRGASKSERLDAAVDMVRKGANVRQAARAVRLSNSETAIARRCDQRGVPRKRSPALPQWETHIPDPVIVPK